MDAHEVMDLHGCPRRNHGSPWMSTICGCPRDSMEVHGGVIWCVKCRLSLHRAGSNLCHFACKVSDMKGTEWGRIGAKRRKRLGAASTFSPWDITQPYHHPYAHICMQMHSYGYTCIQIHADARPLPHPRLTLHAYACMCIHMKCICMQMCAYAYPLRTLSMHSIHLHAWVWRCMHIRACACMCMQMDDCFNHSLCNSSLYGLYVMAFHRVPSEGGVLV